MFSFLALLAALNSFGFVPADAGGGSPTNHAVSVTVDDAGGGSPT